METPVPSLTERLLKVAVNALIPAEVKSGIWGSDYYNFMGIQAPGGGGGDEINDTPSDYTRAVTAESYVYRAVTVRGNGIAQAPLRCYELDKSRKRGDAVDHDALAVLDFTNPMVGSVRGIPNLLRYTLGSQDTHGHAAWVLAFNRRGTLPTEIYWQPPASYSVTRDPQANFGGITRNGDPANPIPADRVVYLPTPNLGDPLMGTSKIRVLRNAINLRQAGVRSNANFFKNSMRPDWVLGGAFLNTEENIARIRRALRKWLTGETNRSPLILGENAKATLLTMNAKDAEWILQQRLSGEEISMVFGVPVIYLNNYERSTYENIGTAKVMLWHDGIIPDADPLASMLTRDFLWRFWPDTTRKFELGFDYTAVEGLAEDIDRLVERTLSIMRELGAFIQDGALLPNQARPILQKLFDQLDLPSEGFAGDVPGGDQTLDLYTKVPRGQHSVQAIIDVMAARGENPELVEDVPGAPNAGKNASAAAQRRSATPPPVLPGRTPPPTPTSDAPPRPTAPKALELAEVSNVVRLAIRQELPRLKARVKRGPHPIKVRDTRLADPLALTTRRLKRYFQELQAEAVRTLRKPKGLAAGEVKALPDPEAPLYNREAAQSKLQDVVRDGVAAATKAAYFAAKEDYGLDVSWDEDHPFVADYMGLRTSQIRGIDLTTQKTLIEALKASAQAGEAIPQAADRITEVFKAAIGNRAETIARSELIPAYGMASVRAYRDSGLAKAEMYDGTGDPECAAVDGRVVSLEEAEQLLADEHPNGTRGVAPFVDLSDLEAAGFDWDANGIAVA